MPSSNSPLESRGSGFLFLFCLAASVLLGCPGIQAQEAREPVRFNRDIRPLLSDRCFACHGPDASTREADLRLDLRDHAIAEVIVPGNADASEFMVRIATEEADDRMPPPEAHKKALSAEEIALFRRWIDEGAVFEAHWSLVAPSAKKPSGGATSTVDAYVDARLKRAGMKPAPRARPHELLRRVTLDLTGLPPSLEAQRRFAQDSGPEAFEREVDRLLARDQFGEHMARYWLDAARYGDTHGLHLDNYREMWPYRDWVIEAFNQNMPYDRFVTEQIAGDLLPQADTHQLVASGFNRCHVTTNEGGVIEEEVRVRNVYDRVDTFGTVFLGMTLGCAKCHDHKFDPISQKDYFQFYAYFNSLDGKALDDNAKAPAPVIKVPNDNQTKERIELTAKIADLEKAVNGPLPEVDRAQRSWEDSWRPRLEKVWSFPKVKEAAARNGATLTKQKDHSVLAEGNNPAKDQYEVVLETKERGLRAIRLEALPHPSLGQGSVGRAKNGNFVLSEIEAEIVDLGDPGAGSSSLKFVAARSTYSQDKYPVVTAINGRQGDSSDGWAADGHHQGNRKAALFVTDEPFGFEQGTRIRLRMHFQSQYSQHAIGRFRFAVSAAPEVLPEGLGDWHLLEQFSWENRDEVFDRAFGPEQGFDLARSYPDGLVWKRRADLEDGKTHALQEGIGASYLARIIHAPVAAEVEASLGSDDGIRVWLNDVEVFKRKVDRGVAPDQDRVKLDLREGANKLLIKIVNTGGQSGFYFRLTSESTRPDFALTEALMTGDDAGKVTRRNFFRRNHSKEWKDLSESLAAHRKRSEELENAIPTTLVFKEMKEPRPAHILKRGLYDQPGELVQRETPSWLPEFPDEASRDRLGLARWLFQPEHPLTARVAVNRFWQQCFGTGLVETAEDFGNQGSPPSHPELLDWLAVSFREDGWDVKKLMKRIVMSEAYQRSSRSTATARDRDPKNRLLARGPRFRMDAEMLRDQALFLSGLLVEKIGGPSVKPPQPEGLWFAVGYSGSNTDRFKADEDPEARHRRSLYTFLKRTSPPPQMIDAPTRETCIVRRERTNSPLHALMFMNDPQYLETSRALAVRMIGTAKEPSKPATIAEVGYELATGRKPSPRASAVLVEVFQGHLDEFRSSPQEAARLNAAQGMTPEVKVEAEVLAAWTMVANLILNLDEVLNKN